VVARVTTYRGRVEQLIEGFDQTAPVLATKPGSLAVDYLVDTQGGMAMTISFWESAEAAERTAAWAEQARDRTVAATGLTIEDVRIFDVVRHAQARAARM
jgi:heme-degrading monooxygenase HmoA